MIPRISITRTLGPHSQEAAGRTQGITDPWHAWGTDNQGIERRVILKLAYPGIVEGRFNRIEMLVREYICYQLLDVLGVPVPKPYLAEIPELVIKSMRSRPDIQAELRKNNLPHFACEYLENMHDLPISWKLTGHFLSIAEDILASDCMVLNADRTRRKPNLLFNANRLVAIDYGLAFQLLKQNPSADRLPPELMHEHVCYRAIITEKPTFKNVFSSWVNSVTREVLDRIEASVPGSWKTEEIDVDSFINHLRAHDARLDKIRAELIKSFPQ